MLEAARGISELRSLLDAFNEARPNEEFDPTPHYRRLLSPDRAAEYPITSQQLGTGSPLRSYWRSQRRLLWNLTTSPTIAPCFVAFGEVQSSLWQPRSIRYACED